MKYLVDRATSWMTLEPFIGLMMIIAAVVLFFGTYRKALERDQGGEDRFWPWFRRVVESLAVSVLFLGLLWSFRAILNSNLATFEGSHGRVSEANYESLQTIWGGPQVQQEIRVEHSVERTVEEELPREDPSKPPLFHKVTKRFVVPQNSILGSSGSASLAMNQRKKGSALYSGYDIAFETVYRVVNDSEETTEADFTFPLAGQVLYDDFQVLEDGRDIGPELRIDGGAVRWSETMKPQERREIKVSYRSRGVEFFYYQVPDPRQINGFDFTVTIDKMRIEDVNYPGNCLTPTEKPKPTPDGRGVILEWKLDGSITTAGMGVALAQPAQPGAEVALVLERSPYALMLLVVSVSLTLIILGQGVRFLELALLSGAYCLLFIVLSSVSDYLFGFWGSLAAGAVLTMALAYVLYRRHPVTFVRWSVLALVAFFTLVYPLSGLFPDFRNAFNGLVTAAMIVYLFLIALRSGLAAERKE